MVLTSGCFDGVHAGHVLYLEAAKALCTEDETLVCAVAPDSYIQSAKGRKPYWTQADRVRTVSALECVDAVIPQASRSVAQLIRDYLPRLFVKGPDWVGKLPEDVQLACEQVGTVIGFVDSEHTHTSDLQVAIKSGISDDEALARFEKIVLSQKPAEKPWEPVTDYSFEARKAIEGKHPELIRDVFQHAAQSFRQLSVCDVGCGPGQLMRLLEEIGVHTCGIDSNPAYARDDFPRVSCVDIASPSFNLTTDCDVAICREVFEHLTITGIAQAVRNIAKLWTRYVYATTRFAKAPDHFLAVDQKDDLDPTHISMLNQSFVRTLFVLEGFKRRADLETKLDWQRKGRCLVYERT